MLGNSGVGKSSFVHRLLTGEHDPKYNCTRGVEVTELPSFPSNRGLIKFTVHDKSGQEPPSDPSRALYYEGVQCAIIIFDVSSKLTYKNVVQYYEEADACAKGIPMVLVGNKVDYEPRKVKDQHVKFHENKPNMQYYGCSALSGENCRMPFLWLARKLTNDQTLQFV